MMFEKMPKKRRKRRLIWLFVFGLSFFFPAVSFPPSQLFSGQEVRPPSEKKPTLLKLLDIMPSSESIDFVQGKTRLLPRSLPAEQRHPKTWNLSERIEQDLEAGLHMLFSVDGDITAKLASLESEKNKLEMAVQAVEEAILSGNRIYLFGCEETGRWMKQIESSLWRPFWKGLKDRKKMWVKISPGTGESIEDRLIGEMPGADRSLIQPLAGFDDLMLLGRLQLLERGIEPGDVIICVSGRGTAPAVIGTLLEAVDHWKRLYPHDAEKMKKRLFFFFNNPEEALFSFDHVRAVMEEPGITKIDLTTGPQALTGSLRMQASTIDTFVIANIVQVAIDRCLRRFLNGKEMEHLGFRNSMDLTEKLGEFSRLLKKVERIIPSIARLCRLEESACTEGRQVTYAALKGMATVFNDCAERSSTFFLSPFDSVEERRPGFRIQVWALKEKQEEGWLALLGRPFRGLSPSFYEKKIEKEIPDSALKHCALESLKNASGDQQFLYDFAFSENNRQKRGPKKGELGILVVFSSEEEQIKDKKSDFYEFLNDVYQNGANTGLMFLTEKSEEKITKLIRKIPQFDPKKDASMVLTLDEENDPMGLNRQIALKIILNAHSTAVMARTGKIIGNSVFVFEPEDPQSIDRATYLVQSYVNDILQHPRWVRQYGVQNRVSYGEANAILFDSIASMKEKINRDVQPQAVGLSIVRVLESIRLKRPFSQEEALSILQKKGLESYLKDVDN